MFSLETAIKNLIADAIVLAYEKIQDGNKDIAPSDGKPEEIKEAPAPGGVRKCRTKAEIEASKQNEAILEVPKIEYKTLQEAILNYITEYGSKKVLEVLGQFGVSKAQALQPEQWEECYTLIMALPRDEEIA